VGVTYQVAPLPRKFRSGRRAVQSILFEAEFPWDKLSTLFSYPVEPFTEHSTAGIVLLIPN
jgi:hypothetical protein